jgi:hypothetical protein
MLRAMYAAPQCAVYAPALRATRAEQPKVPIRRALVCTASAHSVQALQCMHALLAIATLAAVPTHAAVLL